MISIYRYPDAIKTHAATIHIKSTQHLSRTLIQPQYNLYVSV